MTDLHALTARRDQLRADIEDATAELKHIDAQIIDALGIGGTIDGYKVQVRRTFSVDKARDLLPQELIDAATVPTLDPKVLRGLIPPAVEAACMVEGKPFIAKAGR